MSFYFNKFLSHSFLTVGLWSKYLFIVSSVFSVKFRTIKTSIKVPVDFLDEINADLKPESCLSCPSKLNTEFAFVSTIET